MGSNPTPGTQRELGRVAATVATGRVLVGSERADGALFRIDFDVGAMGDAGGRSVGADHRGKTEPRHDRGVTHRSAFFHHEAPITGSSEFTDGPVNGVTNTSPGSS